MRRLPSEPSTPPDQARRKEAVLSSEQLEERFGEDVETKSLVEDAWKAGYDQLPQPTPFGQY